MSIHRDPNNDYEVIIIGGSYAGLSAALALGRAMRKTLIIDSGKPCNRSTPHSHNFLTQDGETPHGIHAIAKSQVLAYPTITLKFGTAIAISRQADCFQITMDDHQTFYANSILFATGITDEYPPLQGFSECWGKSVIHFPYCHGYEFRHQRTVILANGNDAFEMGRLINNWTKDLTILTNGPSTINPEHRATLAALSINVIEQPVKELVHRDGQISAARFTGKDDEQYTVMYARLPFKQHTNLPVSIGCLLNERGYIQVDDFQQTSVPGIYAAGDCTSMLRSVSTAVAAGTKAGAMINHAITIKN